MHKEVILHQKLDPKVIRVLRNEGYHLVDMHFHTRHSDGVPTVAKALAKAKKLGIGVAITDHNEIQGALIASQQDEVFIIPGMEVTCQEGMHILLYFYTIKDYIRFFEHHIKPYRTDHTCSFTKIPVRRLAELASGARCIFGPAHPYAIGLTGIMQKKHKGYIDEKLLRSFTFIEGLCGSSMRGWNAKSQALALQLSKPMTGGSDGHTIRQLGHIVTYAHGHTTKQFLNAIKKGQAGIIGKETNLMYNVGSQMVKIKNISSLEEYMKREVKAIASKINGHSKSTKGYLF